MKLFGITKEKGRIERIKWGCPKVHMVKERWYVTVKKLCSSVQKGRTSCAYENMELRMFPGIQWDTEQWNSLYKIRTIVEKVINYFKINMCVTGRHTRIHLTTKADVFLNGIDS